MDPVQGIQDIYVWWTQHAVEVLAVIGYVVLIARLVVKMTPTPKDDSFLASVIEFCRAIGIVIPDAHVAEMVALKKKIDAVKPLVEGVDFNRPDPHPLVEGVNVRIQPTEPGMFTTWTRTTTTPTLPLPEGVSLGRRRDERPLIRKLIQREAQRNGLTLTHEQEDAAIGELRAKHQADFAAGGKVWDFLEWLIAHADTIAAVLKLVILLFAADPKEETA